MDFYVFDTMDMYKRKNPEIKFDELTNLKIHDIAITDQGAFWFTTNMEREVYNTNLNRPYVHFHKKMEGFTKLQYRKEPTIIDPQKVYYNPKTKKLEIKKPGSIWPWSKPFWSKNVKGRYYGNALPTKNTKVLGEWLFDYRTTSISVILNYYTGLHDKYGKPIKYEMSN